MSEEEKEQWLYEEYKYTSNFNFNRLDKYEEANNDLCIDDLILDYTMLYEHYKKEIERLKNIIKEVREKIDNTTINCEGVAEDLVCDIYEILDKEKQDV